MNKLEYYPEIRVYKGSGILKSIAEEIKLEFIIVIYPHAIRIFSDQALGFFHKSDDWSFQGQIENGQIVVSSSVLILFSSTDKGIVLMPQKEFIIGNFNNNQIVSAEFPLIGYYGDEVEFEYENCLYRIGGDKQKADKQEKLSKTWEVQLEGFNLEITSKTPESNRYNPVMAKFDFGFSGFSSIPKMFSLSSTSTTPNFRGSSASRTSIAQESHSEHFLKLSAP